MATTMLSAEPGEVRLRDGTIVLIRPIEAGDAPGLVAFHETLSFETIRRRFFGAHPHLSEAEAQRFATVDHHDREALVAELDGELIAVGRYERRPGDATAEVAFVVTDAWQGRGLAPILLQGLAARARIVGITRFVAETLSENRAMLSVFSHSGLPTTTTTSRGVVDVSMKL
jgi:GNAT superfamily N-acetyltransferase